MIVKVADYIVSPLAMGSKANYLAVKEGRSLIGGPDATSLLNWESICQACRSEGIDTARYTKFEMLSILAAARALKGCKEVDPAGAQTLFILSTTKGYWGEESKKLPPDAAEAISQWFNNPNEPLVVCNACISGADAQVAAARALKSGRYKYAVVIGADLVTPFVLSGFKALNATSKAPCRPFDEERTGLNLGEAAAAVVFGAADERECHKYPWHFVAGAVRNDAFHITNPYKSAEGAYSALQTVYSQASDPSDIAFVNLHGTATLFNDEMEAVALHRAGLESLPANGLKGYFGHTLGAAGIIETLISMESLEDKTLPATKGFERLGVSKKINISNLNREIKGNSFIKMISGFGGGNAALLFEHVQEREVEILHKVEILPEALHIDGQKIETKEVGEALLKELYTRYVGDYPKFHKMDLLSKVGFIASELLLNRESECRGVKRFAACQNRAVLLMGSSGSICADTVYMQTIASDNYFPSPAAFIYTLPNIVTGEIAIRNNYHGPTTFLLQKREEPLMEFVKDMLNERGIESILAGFTEAQSGSSFMVKMYIAKFK